METVSRLDSFIDLPSPSAVLLGNGGTFLRIPREQQVGLARQALAGENLELRLFVTSGRDGSAWRDASRCIAEASPDFVALDCSPTELNAQIMYSFSLACAVGLPVQFEIVDRLSFQTYLGGEFHPDSVPVAAVIESWLRNIPVVPVGRPVNTAVAAASARRSSVSPTHPGPGQYPPARPPAGTATVLDSSRRPASLQRSPSGTIGQDIIYMASRVADIAQHSRQLGRPVRLFAVVREEHGRTIASAVQSLRENGATGYLAPEPDIRAAALFMMADGLHDTEETGDRDNGFRNGHATGLFQKTFDSIVAETIRHELPPAEATGLIAEIAGRTRSHPDIVRGASVRAAIAFAELLDSIAEVRGNRTPLSLARAALITLPPRIQVREKGNEVAVITDIVKEVLYGIRFSGQEETAVEVSGHLSADDIPEGLEQFGITPQKQRLETARGQSFAVVQETGSRRGSADGSDTKVSMKDAAENRYYMAKRAVMSLINDLEEKLRAGEITSEEFEEQKASLMGRLRNTAASQFRMSSGQIASTIIEMMDAQDKQWNSEITMDRLHVYYHIKGTSEGVELSPLKEDYHALKWLVDDLQKKGILRPFEKAQGLLLTGLALDFLLKHLTRKDGINNATESALGPGRVPTSYRGHGVRRYSAGDTFRDISVRHTLREVARGKKSLSAVRSSDIRVFLKERRRPRTDMVLCVDISGSMGFRQKLTYARLVAAGLVEAGIKEGNRVGVVAFNDYGQTTVALTGTERQTLIDGVAALAARGNTNIGDGIRASREMLLEHRNRNRKQIVLISDGQPSAVSEKAFSQLKQAGKRDLTEESALFETRQAAAAGIQLSVVYIAPGNETGDLFMSDLAKAGKGNLYCIRGLADLKAMLRH